jgi:hypothetical protein
MTTIEIIPFFRKLLADTQPLFDAPAASDEKFSNVFLGIYRISHETSSAVCDLAETGRGSAVLALSRKNLEYLIALEYMLLKGKEEMAEKFQAYLYKEVHDEVQFMQTIGVDLTSMGDEFCRGAEMYEKEYKKLNSKMKRRKNWAGLSIEEMMLELHGSGDIKDYDNVRLTNAYIWGCRASHVSSSSVRLFMSSEDHQASNAAYLEHGLVYSLIAHYRLSCRYVDEIRSHAAEEDYPDVVHVLKEAWKVMDAQCLKTRPLRVT